MHSNWWTKMQNRGQLWKIVIVVYVLFLVGLVDDRDIYNTNIKGVHSIDLLKIIKQTEFDLQMFFDFKTNASNRLKLICRLMWYLEIRYSSYMEYSISRFQPYLATVIQFAD